MNQIAHVFRKDLRRHWIEILFTLAVVAAEAWNEQRNWAPQREVMLGFRDRIIGFLPLLLVLSWCFLIVRVVQGEALAGDRQYWITRPYEWKKLLALKILFIVAVVQVPAFIVGAFLLTRAGFTLQLSFAPALLGIQATIAASLLLPIAALATVTSTVAQMAVVLVALGLYIAGVAAIASNVPNSGFSSGSDSLQGAVFIAGCLIALILQYARRKTGISRRILACTAVSILLIVVATPYRTLVAREYPRLAPSEPPPVQSAIDPAKPPAPVVVPDEKKVVEIQIPLRVSGMDPNSFVLVDGAMLTIESQDGQRWSSEWKSATQLMFPGQDLFRPDFEVQKVFFERVQSSSVRTHISFALTIFRDKNPRRVIATDGDFAVPDVGFCSIDQTSSNSVHCRFAISVPSLVVVKTVSSDSTCSVSEADPTPAGRTAEAWHGKTDASYIFPVGTFSIYFWSWNPLSARRFPPRICPGIPLTFSMPEEVKRTGMELDLNGIQLADYRVSNSFRFMFDAPPRAVAKEPK